MTMMRPRIGNNPVPVFRIGTSCEEDRDDPVLLVIIPILWLSLLVFFAHPVLATELGSDPQISNGESGSSSSKIDDKEVVQTFLEGRYKQALEAYKAGNFEKAWKMSEAILILAPDNLFIFDRVNALRRRAQGRHLSRSSVAVRFSIEEDEDDIEGGNSSRDDSLDDKKSPFPKPFLTGVVLLENLSDEAIQFGDGRAEEDILGQVVWRVREVYLDGTERVWSDTRVLRIEGGFRVDPGASRGIPVQLPIPVSRYRPLIQEWIVAGNTRPLKLKTPEGEVTRGLPWIEERGRFLDPDMNELSTNPREGMRLALVKGDVPGLVLARHLWLDRRHERKASPDLTDPLIEEVISSLGSHEGKMDYLLVGVLEEITGLIMERSARIWKIWGLSRQVRRDGGDGR